MDVKTKMEQIILNLLKSDSYFSDNNITVQESFIITKDTDLPAVVIVETDAKVLYSGSPAWTGRAEITAFSYAADDRNKTRLKAMIAKCQDIITGTDVSSISNSDIQVDGFLKYERDNDDTSESYLTASFAFEWFAQVK